MKEQLLRVGQGTLIYGLGQILNQLISFLLLPLFTAYLKPSETGVIAIFSLIVFFVGSLFCLGIPMAMGPVYYRLQEADERDRVFSTAFALLVMTAVALFFSAITFQRTVSRLAFGTDAYAAYVPYIGVHAAMTGVLAPVFALRLQFEERAKLYAALSSVSLVTTIGFNIVYVVFLGQGVGGWVKGVCYSSVISLAIYIAAVSRGRLFRFDPGIARNLLWTGVQLLPTYFFVFLMQQSGRYSLQWQRSLDDVGIYSVGYGLGMGIFVCVGAFTTAWFPFFNSYVHRQEEAGRVFGSIALYYGMILGSVCMLFFAFAKAVTLLMTEFSYHSAYLVVGLVAVSQYLFGFFSILQYGMYFRGELRLLHIAYSVGSAVILLLNRVLIGPLGISGAAISLAAGYTAVVVVQLFVNRWRNYFPLEFSRARLLGYFSFMALFILLVRIAQDRISGVQGNVAFALAASAILVITMWGGFLRRESDQVKVLLRQFVGSDANKHFRPEKGNRPS